VCPFLFEDLDAMLTNEADGSPTLFYYGCVAGCVALALACLAGTFATPGLPEAWAASDPLLGLAVCGRERPDLGRGSPDDIG
jgi:hypothetical protein